MPEISRFYGIVIKMYYNDHAPPHFHVIYGSYEAIITIFDIKIFKGELPPRAFGMVMEWTLERRNELIKDWELAKNKETIFKIEPLK